MKKRRDYSPVPGSVLNSKTEIGPARSLAGFLTKTLATYSVFGSNPSTSSDVVPFTFWLPVLHPGPLGFSLGHILYSISAVSSKLVPFNEATSSKLMVAFVPETSLASTLVLVTGGPRS